MAKFPKIIVNGKEVGGPEDVPALLKQFVQDADKNGVPDFIEGFLKNPLFKMVLGKTGGDLQKVLANIPPDKRAKLEEIMKKLGVDNPMGNPMSNPTSHATSAGAGPTVTVSTETVSTPLPTLSFGAPSTGSSYRSATPSSGGDFQIDYKKLGIADPSGESSGSKVKSLLWIVVGLAIAAAVYWFQYAR